MATWLTLQSDNCRAIVPPAFPFWMDSAKTKSTELRKIDDDMTCPPFSSLHSLSLLHKPIVTTIVMYIAHIHWSMHAILSEKFS